MNNDDPTTPGEDPAATGGEQEATPAATTPQGTPGATDDDQVTLPRKDYNNLIAARDRANNTNSELEPVVNDLLRDKAITSFLQENQQKFPDVSAEDLASATSPDEIESLAKRTQDRYEAVVQKRLLDVQTSEAPKLSPQEKSARLEQLRKSPTKGGFAEMIRLQSS